MNILLIILLLTSSVGYAQSEMRPQSQAEPLIHQIEFQGLQRTSEGWLRELLPQPPFQATATQLEAIRKSLTKRNVFWDVQVKVENKTLKIHLKEKWTTIPVFRGEFGGGTGLTILGGYDTHMLGKGWTLGAEFRKYGTRPTGGVAYLRIPSLWGQYFSFDIWDIYREQRIHNNNKWVSTLCTRQQKIRNRILQHITPHLDAGVDWSFIQQEPSNLKVHKEHTTPVLPLEASQTLQILGSMIYDNIHIETIHYVGLRGIARAGINRQEKLYPLADLELFYYKPLTQNDTLASHLFVGATTGESLSDWFLLGGLESVRGIPDGAMAGQKVIYTNIEWRHMLNKWPKLSLQGLVFVDAGVTEFDQAESVGVGLRVAVPQIHRFMLRVDYAVSRQGFSGFSIGLNHFFQPYRPL